jgi:preprotein translocase subunit SecG
MVSPPTAIEAPLASRNFIALTVFILATRFSLAFESATIRGLTRGSSQSSEDPMRYQSSASSYIKRVVHVAAVAFFLLLLFLFQVAESQAQSDSAKAINNSVAGELTSIGNLRKNLKAFLKNSKRDLEPEVKHAAILNLLQLHHWVVNDPRFNQSESLQGIRSNSATRLSTISKELETAEKRRVREKGKSSNATADDSRLIRSQFGNVSDDNLADSASRIWDEAILHSYSMATYTSGSFHGGAGQMLNYLGGRFGPNSDWGMELVALIQSTIDPRYWRVNGGPGSIHYYRPGLALVVTGSQEMQDRVRTLLLQLRAAF